MHQTIPALGLERTKEVRFAIITVTLTLTATPTPTMTMTLILPLITLDVTPNSNL